MKLLVLLIDALPFELLKTKIKLPVVHENCLPLIPILGFSESIRATIFSGTSPSTHKNWGTFSYEPPNSSFNFLQPFKFVDYLPFSLLKRAAKFIISKTRCVKEARNRGYHQLSTRNMPYSLLSLFHYIPKYRISSAHSLVPVPTFFDILSSEEMRFIYLEWHNLGSSIFDKLRKEGPISDVIIIYLDHLDRAAHRYGLWSKKFIDTINEVIEIRKKILDIMNEIWGDYTYLTFSDHGMVSVNQYLPLNKVLGGTNLEDKNFLVIAGATYLRLWFLNEKAKETITNKLNEFTYGALLTEDEQDHMGILFKHRCYFDRLFLFKPGIMIFPNYYGWLKPQAMHGYDPYESSQLGCFEMDKNQFQLKNVGAINVIDIMPTMLDIMGLKIPATCEGKSIVR